MPQNLSLEPVKLPMKLKFGQPPTTTFHDNLDALKVELVDSPTRDQAWHLAWHYVKATWADQPGIDPNTVSYDELSRNLEDVLGGRTLPAPLECLGFTFRLSGLSFQEVTHIIRHRAGTFAAQCTGDRDLRDDDAVIPEAVRNSPEFLERWKKIVLDSKQLYADMTDSKVVSMMDARVVLPKCLTSFYYMRLSLKDLIGFINQRQDVAVQPQSDNLLAIMMAIEVCRVLPEFGTVVDVNKPDWHFIKTFRVPGEDGKFVSRGTNLYWPTSKNDKFEYHPDDTLYQCYREDLIGTHPPVGYVSNFTQKWNAYVKELDFLKSYKERQNELFNWCDKLVSSESQHFQGEKITKDGSLLRSLNPNYDSFLLDKTK